MKNLQKRRRTGSVLHNRDIPVAELLPKKKKRLGISRGKKGKDIQPNPETHQRSSEVKLDPDGGVRASHSSEKDKGQVQLLKKIKS